MNEQVHKFVGCYDCATRQKNSGQNEDDVLELAHKLYLQDHGKKAVKFGLEHVWRVLRKEEKWCKSPSKTKPIQKKSKLNDSSAYSSNSTANTICLEEKETMQRPMGVKAAKGKGKRKLNLRLKNQ